MATDERSKNEITDARIALLIMGHEPTPGNIPPYSRDLLAAWQVKEKMYHLPWCGIDELRRAQAVAMTFDDVLAQTNILDMTAEEAAEFICAAALVAIQENIDAAAG